MRRRLIGLCDTPTHSIERYLMSLEPRRSDPRIGEMVNRAIGNGELVANIGAGTGSYEPPQTVVAVEPSRVMIDQRPPRSAPAVQATAEAIPLGIRRGR
jgi:hypothetical protein